MSDAATFDMIIVGAGAAGCVLANRLSEDSSRQVLLLEAGPDFGQGPDEWPRDLLDPGSIWPDAYSWGYSLSGREPSQPFLLPRTRLVGGTTGVNGCVWLRGSAADYDEWAALGNPGWGFGDLLPYFQRAEADPGGGPLAGRQGPVPVFRAGERELAPAEHAFMQAAAALGMPIVDDLNATAEQRPGVGPAPKNIADGMRMNASFTYLAPARNRANLSILPETEIDRVLFADGRAAGVRAVDGRLFVARETLLCAGTYGSPAILMRSGIGPGGHLAELGIPVLADLPGVGEHLLDHPLLSPDRAEPRLVRPEFAPTVRSFIPVIAKARSRQVDAEIDLHIYIGQNYSEEHGAWFFWITASLQYARSRGRVRLTAADPHAPLTIDHAYLSEPVDLAALCEGIDLAERLVTTAPLVNMLDRPAEDAPPWGGRDELPAWAREHFGTTYHPSSTCRMGPASDRVAVVDNTGRVYGVEGLRVADASIFPTGPRANLHCSVVAVAEKLADDVRRERPA